MKRPTVVARLALTRRWKRAASAIADHCGCDDTAALLIAAGGAIPLGMKPLRALACSRAVLRWLPLPERIEGKPSATFLCGVR